ncbi:MAG: hypothetical protein WC196_06055 [Bacilli bacterium]|jgi:uncharacterized membrane protein
MQVKSKALGITIGILLAIAMLSVIGCAMAGLIMLGWNVVGVMALSIAIPITFLTALKGVGILFLILFLVNVVRTAIQAYSQKMQMTMAMKAMKSFSDEMAKAENGDNDSPDLMRHFKF